ncbi:hypothetical protein E3G68_005116 [Mycobacteroides abscessus]|uniref:hypothetical protein n=1 Tax=Mycobacteroides abscessus TaxID=36809 RepID=UPI001C6D1951|nr:hypothetical protein [Mycobacteroides abscessus]
MTAASRRPAINEQPPHRSGRADFLVMMTSSTTVPAVIRMGLWPIEMALKLLVAACVTYITLYVAATAIPANPATPNPTVPSDLPFDTFANFLAQLRDVVGHVITFGGTGTPSLTGAVLTALTAITAERTMHTITRPPQSRLRVLSPVTSETAATHDGTDNHDRNKKRIAEVHAALVQLDAEWLAYEQDLEAYYLTKPVLRDLNVPETAAYRAALFDLREHADALTDSASTREISAAEQAAEVALLAWGAANAHAAAVGVSDRSPTERAALRRLHALVSQLAHPSTPKPMWTSITDAITREMTKLTTVPTSWNHLLRLPALEHRNPPVLDNRGPGN